jgi:hypothetical protein
MKIKGRGFPLEYYPGEILTEREAGINRKMFLFRVTGMGGALTPNVSVMLPPPPTAINRIQFTSLDSMVSQTKPSSLIAPVITNQPDKSILTDLQLDEFNQISSKFLDSSISMDEAILQLRGGGKFKDISFIVLYIWLYRLQNNHVESFQPIYPPHQEWMQNRAHQRPPYAGGYSSSNSGSSLGLTHTNDGFNELSRTKIQNAYSQIPNLSVEGTNQQVTAWSAAKHIHHSPDFGMDPTKYGMTQKDLDSIAKNGLISHIRDGGTPPNDEYVKAFQQRWKRFAEHKDFRECGIQTVMGQDCHVLKHNRTRIFLAIKTDSGESFTGYQLTERQSVNHNNTGIIGKNYKN